MIKITNMEIKTDTEYKMTIVNVHGMDLDFEVINKWLDTAKEGFYDVSVTVYNETNSLEETKKAGGQIDKGTKK